MIESNGGTNAESFEIVPAPEDGDAVTAGHRRRSLRIRFYANFTAANK